MVSGLEEPSFETNFKLHKSLARSGSFRIVEETNITTNLIFLDTLRLGGTTCTMLCTQFKGDTWFHKIQSCTQYSRNSRLQPSSGQEATKEAAKIQIT